MILGSFVKQPVEVLDYDIDYSDWVISGDNIIAAGVDVQTDDPALVITRVTVSDPVVKVWVGGGENGTTYKVTLTVTTADGRVKQDEFRIVVRDF
jgi:hypothetical protein